VGGWCASCRSDLSSWVGVATQISEFSLDLGVSIVDSISIYMLLLDLLILRVNPSILIEI